MTRHEREEARKSLDPPYWLYESHEETLEARSNYLGPALDHIDRCHELLRRAAEAISSAQAVWEASDDDAAKTRDEIRAILEE